MHLPPSIGSEVVAGARTLKACFAQPEELASFRRRLGLTEPTQFTVLTDYILPLYAQDEVELPAAVHQAHMQQLPDCWRTSGPAEQEELSSRLRELAFIRGSTYPQGESGWYKPAEVYLTTDDLRTYFSASKTVFVVETFYGELLNSVHTRGELLTLWKQAGMWDRIQLQSYPFEPTSEDNRHWQKLGRLNRPYDQRVVNFNLDGLDELFDQDAPVVTVPLSGSLFRLLCQYSAVGDLRPFERQYTFTHQGRRHGPYVTGSFALEILTDNAWLFDTSGRLCRPEDFAAAGLMLAADYDLTIPGASQLLETLQIPSGYRNVLDELPASEREWIHLLRRQRAIGLTDEQLKTWIAQLQPAERAIPDTPATAPPPVSAADKEREQAAHAEREAAARQATGQKAANVKPEAEPAESPAPEELTGTDPNELSWASAEKLRRARRQLDELEDELRAQDDLARAAQDAEPYTYAWFLAMLKLEMLLSNRRDEKASAFSLSFAQVACDPHSPHLLLLREPAGYIPRTVEDFPGLQLRLYMRDNQPPRSISIDVVSVKDFTLRARVSATDLASIDPAQVKRASIQIQSPEFLLDRLLTQFQQLADGPYHLQPADNLQQRLPANLRFVFGPPSTGKTYHLAHHEIARLMQADRPWRILVLTPTNKAADVLTGRLLPPSADPSLPPVCPPWLVRYGQTAEAALEAVPFLVRNQKDFQYTDQERCTVITTAARFPYAEGADGQRLADLDWDYVILDEASMIPLYQAVNIIYQLPDCREFIIGGDPLQIPPVVYAEPWAGQNIYTLVGLRDFVHPTTTPHSYPVERLLMQRRATPPLGRLFSEYAYGGRLTHARPLHDQHVAGDGILYEGRQKIPLGAVTLGDITIVRFPVRKGEGPFEARKLDQGSNYHAYSALLVAELVRYLGAQAAGTSSSYRTGIISPYAAQTTLLREVIRQLPQTEQVVNVNEDIGTVHGFQGDECHLVIALLGTPPTTGAGIMLNLPHILNVAVSRARDRLVLFVPDY